MPAPRSPARSFRSMAAGRLSDSEPAVEPSFYAIEVTEMTTTTTRRDAKTRGRAAKTARHAAKVGNGAPKAKWQPGFPGQVVLVLQGGGALGAYQIGVYEAMHEAGVEPDWVIGTSIGAINAALIAGNEPAKRFDRLRQFWSRVRLGGWVEPMVGPWANHWYANLSTYIGGIPGFFMPRAIPRGRL